MFVVNLVYRKPLDELEPHLVAHRAFLDRHYAAGIFLASGPKIPRTGGIIVAAGKVTKPELVSLLKEDPFHIHGLADYEVTEFTPAKFLPSIEGLL